MSAKTFEINWPLWQPFVVYYVNEVEALSLKSTSSGCEFSEMLLSENQLFDRFAGSYLQAIKLLSGKNTQKVNDQNIRDLKNWASDELNKMNIQDLSHQKWKFK